MGKPGRNFAFSSCFLSTFSISFHRIPLPFCPLLFLPLFFSYFGKNISKGREKQMHSYLTPIVSVIYEFWVWIDIETNQQMDGDMNIHEFWIPVLLCQVLFTCKEYMWCLITTFEKKASSFFIPCFMKCTFWTINCGTCMYPLKREKELKPDRCLYEWLTPSAWKSNHPKISLWWQAGIKSLKYYYKLNINFDLQLHPQPKENLRHSQQRTSKETWN